MSEALDEAKASGAAPAAGRAPGSEPRTAEKTAIHPFSPLLAGHDSLPTDDRLGCTNLLDII